MTPPEGHPGQHAYIFLIRILSMSLTSVSIFSVCCYSRSVTAIYPAAWQIYTVFSCVFYHGHFSIWILNEVDFCHLLKHGSRKGEQRRENSCINIYNRRRKGKESNQEMNEWANLLLNFHHWIPNKKDHYLYYHWDWLSSLPPSSANTTRMAISISLSLSLSHLCW